MSAYNRLKKENKRIAFLGGGAQKIPSYRELLKQLARDYRITIYSEFYLGEEWRVSEYKIKSIPPWKLPGRIREIIFGVMIFIDHIFNRFDIVHTHSTFPSGLVGVIISKIFRIPLIVSLDAAEGIGIEKIAFGDLLHKKRTKINRFVLRHASVITALTEFHKKLVCHNFHLENEIMVIPRGVDRSRFTFSSWDISRPIRFLNVAYMHEVKDQETLLRCFSILSKNMDCTLVQVGKDYRNGQMEKLCAELGIADKVKFAGFVPHENIHSYYKNADVLLHTSLYESQAVVVNEALASGVLVCGTHVGLMADLSGSCCITVPVGGHEQLANCVMNLLGNTDQLNILRTNGRNWAHDHDINWTKNKYIELYESLIR